jgi:hypothetical protein
MESGRMMLVHAVLIGIALYFVMVFVLGQNQHVAENRSILFASVILIYMLIFGHKLPTSKQRRVLNIL